MLTKFKEFVEAYTNEIFLVGVIVLVGFISFGLGRLSVDGGAYGSDLIIESTPIEVNKFVEALDEDKRIVEQGSGTIIGNKNSRIYHRSDCSGALRMSEGNKVFFASIITAKDAGYRPAANCPGLE